MKKLVLLIVWISCCHTLMAGVIFSPQDQIIATCNTSTVCQYNLDLNQDGVPDIGIINEATSTGVGFGIFFQSANNSRIVSFSQSNLDFAQDLAQGTQVGASSNLSSKNSVYLLQDGYTDLLGQTGLYFGIEFYIEQQKHYGWIKVDVNQNYSVKLTEIGYESTADKPIAVGVTNGTGIILVNAIEISSLNDKQTISQNRDTLDLTATVQPADADNKNVAWAVSPSDLGVFDVDTQNSNKAVFHPKKNGNGVIYAIATDGSDTRASYSIFISGQQQTAVLVNGIDVLTVDNEPSVIDIDNGTLGLFSYITPITANNKDVEWSVSDNSLAQIDETGVVTALRNGSVVVYAHTTDGSNLSDSIEIQISNQTDLILADSVVITSQQGNNAINTQNGTLQLYGDIFPANANIRKVEWLLSDTALADITYNGLLIAKANGTLQVFALSIDGSNKIDTFEVQISNQADDFVFIGNLSIEAESNTRLANVGTTVQFYTEFLPANATIQAVKWGIDVPDSVATIDQNGLLTTKKPGFITIFAYALDRSNKVAFRTLTVEAADDILLSNSSFKSESLNVRVFPNPVLEQVTIQTDSEFIKSVQLYSANGQLMETIFPLTLSKTFSYTLPDDIPQGLLYLVIELETGFRTTQKLIRQ